MNVQLLASDFRLVVDRLPAMIGRGPHAGIRLSDPAVSRRHCQIEEFNGLLLIRDLGSTNGTFVNGLRVAETVLIPGDRVSLGETRFWVLYERGTSRAAVSRSIGDEPVSVNSSGPPGMAAQVSTPVNGAGGEEKVWPPTFLGGHL